MHTIRRITTSIMLVGLGMVMLILMPARYRRRVKRAVHRKFHLGR